MPDYIWNAELFRKVRGFGDESFSVELIERADANRIIVEKHYSRKVYNASRIHLGVFAGGMLLGVLQFGAAMNPASMASVVEGTRFEEYLELNRMWLDDRLPRNSESKALSYAIKFIKRHEPRVAWIQSFADERCKRFGVVYQAANFEYCGEHVGRFWELDGEFYHDSILTDGRQRHTPKGRTLRANKDRATCHDLRQFRYVYFIKQSYKRRLLKKIKPFPKHAAEGSRAIRDGSTVEGEVRYLGAALS